VTFTKKEDRMSSNRRIAIIAGILLLIGMITGILSIAPAIDSPDYLNEASANAIQVKLSALFQFIMAIAYLGFALTLYPFLKKYNEKLALGFLSFRIIATIFILVGVIILLLLLSLSQDYVVSETSDSQYFQRIGALLYTGRDLANHVVMIITLNIGGILLYILLLQSRLIPLWLSVWGLIGATLTILASLLVMFSFIEIITPIYIILNLPMAVQELTLAMWLIIKGFNSFAITSKK
jgi:Domain of unknown function (DUF4386)